jgi:3-dehydro-L-gulonate 2-dehydrogenase
MRVSYDEMQAQFEHILRQAGLTPPRASLCARIFVENTLDGVASHGLNRFPAFVRGMQEGHIDPQARPEPVMQFGGWEQWDGQLGPGPLNAWACTDRAMALAHEHGVGCVGLRNTNHWMRGGTYGWKAAEAGFGFTCWTNTIPNMPPWGGVDPHLGNNPFVLAVPREDGHVVLDMAMTQFSYGRLSTTARQGETLPVPGGYDESGELCRDPAAIRKSRRPLPIGYWKGSGLSLLLDLLAAALSGGQTTYGIGQQGEEYAISQTFIAFDLAEGGNAAALDQMIDETIADLHQATPVDLEQPVRYPGERALRTRRRNLAQGIPVEPSIWQQVLDLSQAKS